MLKTSVETVEATSTFYTTILQVYNILQEKDRNNEESLRALNPNWYTGEPCLQVLGLSGGKRSHQWHHVAGDVVGG